VTLNLILISIVSVKTSVRKVGKSYTVHAQSVVVDYFHIYSSLCISFVFDWFVCGVCSS
jgi:hypothetical protein